MIRHVDRIVISNKHQLVDSRVNDHCSIELAKIS